MSILLGLLFIESRPVSPLFTIPALSLNSGDQGLSGMQSKDG